MSYLKRLIDNKSLVRILESHSPLTGLMIDNLSVNKKGKFKEFDGMWSSSLTDSSLRGKPDNQAVDYSTRFNFLSDILDVTKKPVIFDADSCKPGELINVKITSFNKKNLLGINKTHKVEAA